MKTSLIFLITIFAASLVSMTSLTMAQSINCERSCLTKGLDDYMKAIVTNDPSSAPLFIGFRQTENALVVPPGDGMWKSATELGEVQRRFYDPVSGQAVYFGTVMEDDVAAIVLVRLRIERSEISEAEWYIGREGDPGIRGPIGPGVERGNLYNIKTLKAGTPVVPTVAPAERMSRETLIAVTNSYFDGITNNDGSVIMAHPGCLRIENGVQMTGKPLTEDRLDDGYSGKTDCTSSMDTFGVAFVAARRYPVVDEVAQVVLGTGIFIRKPGIRKRRLGLSELFFIEHGKIKEIHAAMFFPPQDRPLPNWPPYHGNFPMPATFSVD
jgi:hypothetical protein